MTALLEKLDIMLEVGTAVPDDTTTEFVTGLVVELVEELVLEIELNVAVDDKVLDELVGVIEYEDNVAKMVATLLELVLLRTIIAPQILESMTVGPGADFK